MGIVVYFFNATFFDPTATLIQKILILSADILIGVTLYGILSRVIQNEEFSFLLDLNRKPKKISHTY